MKNKIKRPSAHKLNNGKQKSHISKTNDRQKELEEFKLGEVTHDYPSTYSPQLLEAFENRNPSNEAWTSLICTEFTSLCPKTGQPDFAKIYVNYIADEHMVESKSFKLYLFSFRNHGDFHEDCIQTICNDLVKLMRPKYIEVLGEFTPRGGIAIFPYASASNSQKKFRELLDLRQRNYAPGLYSMPLSRLY